MKTPLSFALACLLLVAAVCAASGPVYLIPAGPQNQYVLAFQSDSNYTFSTSPGLSREAVERFVPQALVNANRTMFGPIELPPLLINNHLLVYDSNPMQLNIYTSFAPESNCSPSTFRLAPRSIPADVEYFEAPANVSCSPAPRVQIYLPAGRVNTDGLDGPSHNGIDAVCDTFYCYIRTPLVPNGTVALSRTQPAVVEFDFAEPHLIMAELLRLSSMGLIGGVSSQDAISAATAFSIYGERTPEAFSSKAGSLVLHYLPPGPGNESSWQRQPGRYVALWGLQPLVLPPLAPVPVPAVTVPQPPAPPTPTAGNASSSAGAPPSNASDASSITNVPVPPQPPGPTGAQAVTNEVPARAYEPAAAAPSMPWWIVPLVVALLGAFFAAVMMFYYKPRPSGPAPEMIELSESRLAILQDLEMADRIPTDIALRISKSKSTVVEHLDGLCRQGLVLKVQEPGKKFVYYRLTQSGRVLLLKRRSAAAMAQ
ncbi:MAG: winged helix-turn-helix domain-containing protein [Candidatus Micrarchaeota archaeon]